MKVLKFIIIFTTIFSLIFSLSLSASAAEQTLSIVDVSLSPGHNVSYHGIEIYDSFQQAIDNTLWPTLQFPVQFQRYDHYIVFEMIDASGDNSLSDDYFDNLTIDFSPFNVPDANINRIQFLFTMLGQYDEIPVFDFVIDDHIIIPKSAYSYTYEYREFNFIDFGGDNFYARFAIDVIFNESIDLSKGISLVCDYDFFKMGNLDYFDIMGINDPVVSYSSVSEFVEDISSDVKIITDVTQENNELLQQIFSSIESADPETSAKLDDLAGSIVDVNTNLAVSEEQIQRIYDHYIDFDEDPILESGSWEWIYRTYISVLGDSGDSEFASFWYGLWSSSFISVYIIMVIGFAAAYFALHNLR